MSKTISLHNGTTWSRGHNVRDERYTDKQKHIDKTLSSQNVIIRDEPVRQAYEKIFGQAVEEYNAKQKRADRKITDYYHKIKNGKQKHAVYECIVQIGDRSDTGNSAEKEKQALIRYAEEWDKRNPNLKLIGAYIHADEPNGTVHLHCDYVPVAECKRGMKLQNSLERALQQQGYQSQSITQTAQIAWQDSERKVLNAICHDLNIDTQLDQGITKGRGHLTKQEYIRAKEQQQTQIENELQPLKNKLDEYKNLEVAADETVVEKKKIPLVKKVVVSIEELEQLEKQATTYRVNRKEIETLRKREFDIELSKKKLYEQEDNIERKERELYERERQVEQKYYEQENLNEVFERTQNMLQEKGIEYNKLYSKNKEIIAERDSLRSENDNLKREVKTLKSENAEIPKLKKEISLLKEKISKKTYMIIRLVSTKFLRLPKDMLRDKRDKIKEIKDKLEKHTKEIQRIENIYESGKIIFDLKQATTKQYNEAKEILQQYPKIDENNYKGLSNLIEREKNRVNEVKKILDNKIEKFVGEIEKLEEEEQKQLEEQKRIQEQKLKQEQETQSYNYTDYGMTR